MRPGLVGVQQETPSNSAGHHPSNVIPAAAKIKSGRSFPFNPLYESSFPSARFIYSAVRVFRLSLNPRQLPISLACCFAYFADTHYIDLFFNPPIRRRTCCWFCLFHNFCRRARIFSRAVLLHWF